LARRAFIANVLAAAALAAAAAPVGAASAAACTADYGYAGIVGDTGAAAVTARIGAVGRPLVRWGHVAAWVAMSSGSPGSHAWIQAGLAGFEADQNTLYYEVAREGAAPVYTPLRFGVADGERHDVSIRATTGRDTWRVWVDGVAVSGPIELPGSAAWRPMVMAESWNGGTRVCNEFRFAFADVRVARRLGAPWSVLGGSRHLVDPGYRLVGANAGQLLASTER
jgi:hypothetical protein